MRAYLAEQGLTVTAHTDMTLTVAGTAGAAEQAFGVGCAASAARRDARHAPAGAIRLPARIAGAVQAVGGLDTSVRLRPASGRRKLHPLAAGVTRRAPARRAPSRARRPCPPISATAARTARTA